LENFFANWLLRTVMICTTETARVAA
jgi:hypothetical protein